MLYKEQVYETRMVCRVGDDVDGLGWMRRPGGSEPDGPFEHDGGTIPDTRANSGSAPGTESDAKSHARADSGSLEKPERGVSSLDHAR